MVIYYFIARLTLPMQRSAWESIALGTVRCSTPYRREGPQDSIQVTYCQVNQILSRFPKPLKLLHGNRSDIPDSWIPFFIAQFSKNVFQIVENVWSKSAENTPVACPL